MQGNAYEHAVPSSDVAPLFLRMSSVLRLTGLGRSTIYRLIADKKSHGAAPTSSAGARPVHRSPTE
jgi:predicted DNA-binding transcriptional regulator AlpA